MAHEVRRILADRRSRRGGEPLVLAVADQAACSRALRANAARQRYVGDITYLPLADGKNPYLATLVAGFSRHLVGRSVADHLSTDLAADALTAASTARTVT